MTPRPTQEQLENAVYFWNADQPHGQLSQWYPKSFKAGDCTYPTAEHYMMCAKARLFGDTDVEKRILHEAEPEKVRDLGRMIAHFNHDVWEKHKFDLVCDGNRAKFSDPELREVLLATEDRLLVEASPVDKIWGIGFDAKDAPNHYDEWAQNLMGKAISRIRDEIRREVDR